MLQFDNSFLPLLQVCLNSPNQNKLIEYPMHMYILCFFLKYSWLAKKLHEIHSWRSWSGPAVPGLFLLYDKLCVFLTFIFNTDLLCLQLLSLCNSHLLFKQWYCFQNQIMWIFPFPVCFRIIFWLCFPFLSRCYCILTDIKNCSSLKTFFVFSESILPC